MKIIRIIRKSIKKNPNAGNDTTLIPTEWDVKFTTNIPYDELPDYIKEYVIYFESLPDTSEYHGRLKYFDDKLIEYAQSAFKNGNKFSVEVNREIQTFHHFPEADYFYKYENPKIKCSSCHSMIAANDIEKDYDDDGILEMCPKCKEFGTFEYKYEKIQDVLINK